MWDTVHLILLLFEYKLGLIMLPRLPEHWGSQDHTVSASWADRTTILLTRVRATKSTRWFSCAGLNCTQHTLHTMHSVAHAPLWGLRCWPPHSSPTVSQHLSQAQLGVQGFRNRPFTSSATFFTFLTYFPIYCHKWGINSRKLSSWVTQRKVQSWCEAVYISNFLKDTCATTTAKQ